MYSVYFLCAVLCVMRAKMLFCFGFLFVQVAMRGRRSGWYWIVGPICTIDSSFFNCCCASCCMLFCGEKCKFSEFLSLWIVEQRRRVCLFRKVNNRHGMGLSCVCVGDLTCTYLWIDGYWCAPFESTHATIYGFIEKKFIQSMRLFLGYCNAKRTDSIDVVCVREAIQSEIIRHL